VYYRRGAQVTNFPSDSVFEGSFLMSKSERSRRYGFLAFLNATVKNCLPTTQEFMFQHGEKGHEIYCTLVDEFTQIVNNKIKVQDLKNSYFPEEGRMICFGNCHVEQDYSNKALKEQEECFDLDQLLYDEEQEV